MKKLILLVSAVALSAALMAETTVSVDLTAQGYENTQVITTVTIDDAITATFDKADGNNAPAYYTSGEAVRCYAGNTLTIASTGSAITGINFTYGSGSNAVSCSAGSISADYKTWTGSTNSVTFTIGGTSGNRRIKGIEVTYSAGGSETKAVIKAENIDFGLIIPEQGHNAFGLDTIVVSAENLTSAVTFTTPQLPEYQVSAVGSLTAEGGRLAVRFQAEKEGEYSDTITLSSGETQKKVALHALAVFATGKGTKQSPFTTSDVVKLNNRYSTPAWVEGVIVGYWVSGAGVVTEVNPLTALESNIAIASLDGDTIPVELPSGDIRSALNLKSNTALQGRTVRILGTLTNYFDVTGVKTPTEYEIAEEAMTFEVVQTAETITVTPSKEDGTYYISVFTPELQNIWGGLIGSGMTEVQVWASIATIVDEVSSDSQLMTGTKVVNKSNYTTPGTYYVLIAGGRFEEEDGDTELVATTTVLVETFVIEDMPQEAVTFTMSMEGSTVTVTPSDEEATYFMIGINGDMKELFAQAGMENDTLVFDYLVASFGPSELRKGVAAVDVYEAYMIGFGVEQLTDGETIYVYAGECMKDPEHPVTDIVRTSEHFAVQTFTYHNSATAIEHTASLQNAGKHLINGQLYLERDGRRYTMLGQ